jgi:hypothetical protein
MLSEAVNRRELYTLKEHKSKDTHEGFNSYRGDESVWNWLDRERSKYFIHQPSHDWGRLKIPGPLLLLLFHKRKK